MRASVITTAHSFDLGELSRAATSLSPQSGGAATPYLAPSRAPFRRELLDTAGIRAIPSEDWDALSLECLCENPFYSRQYVLAGLETIDRATKLEAVAIRTETGRLTGLFPYRRRWNVAVGAANLYQFSGAPLVHRESAPAVVTAWIDGIVQGDLPSVWSFGHVRVDSDSACLIGQQAKLAGLGVLAVNQYDRPRLTKVGAQFEDHVGSVLTKSRRKDLERSIRRLRELGTLRYERRSDPETVRAFLSDFLELEAAGWKGDARSAFLSRPDHAAFAIAAFGGAPGRDGLASIDALLLDDRPIALSINLTSGETLFTPKCTYDERLRKFSPGLVLEFFVIERFYDEGRFAAMDSATTVGGHVVQNLWNEVMPMGNLVIGKRRAAELVAGAAVGRERLKQAAKRVLRSFRARA